jgi:uncharacterized membrane protein
VRAFAPLLAIVLLAGCGGGSDDGGSSEPATFAEVQQIVERRCLPCHSQNPTIEEYEQAMLIDFGNPDNLMANKEAIYKVVVVDRRMPFNNLTKMTDEERDRIASWAKPETS